MYRIGAVATSLVEGRDQVVLLREDLGHQSSYSARTRVHTERAGHALNGDGFVLS